jgi:hypothetical protein
MPVSPDQLMMTGSSETPGLSKTWMITSCWRRSISYWGQCIWSPKLDGLHLQEASRLPLTTRQWIFLNETSKTSCVIQTHNRDLEGKVPFFFGPFGCHWRDRNHSKQFSDTPLFALYCTISWLEKEKKILMKSVTICLKLMQTTNSTVLLLTSGIRQLGMSKSRTMFLKTTTSFLNH